MKAMGKQIGTAVRLLLGLTVLTGLIYPLAITGAAQVFMPYQAKGSLVVKEGAAIGSALIGQSFSEPRYFHGRPSAAGPNGYDAGNSAGSNLGPTNKQMIESVKERVALIRKNYPALADQPVPADLASASGSGLDPDISPAAALVQVERVAKARNMDADTLQSLVFSRIKSRQLGFLGEERVNVLELNLALDDLKQ